MTSTRVTCRIRAPRSRVYQALIDPEAIAVWRVPDGMTARVHELEPREGGTLRVSLTYDQADGAGKTTPHTDTYSGRFVRLVPDCEVVEVDTFETDDPLLQGEMTSTITLTEVDDGTEVVGIHEGLPPGLSIADNELGWRMALEKLKRLLESDDR